MDSEPVPTDHLSLSVAMATYNGGRHLRDQLESIGAQTRRPDELVIHDDRSTDQTVALLREFARQAPFPVVLRINDVRLGYAENFFSAMKACTGDVVAVADQDDIWLEEKLRRTLQPFLRDSGVALVGHAATVVDESLAPLGTDYPRVPRLRQYPPGRAGPVWGGFPGFALAYRARCAWYAGTDTRPHSLPPDEADLIPHDVWLSLTCGSLGTVVALPDRLALYRRHESNTSSFNPVGPRARLQASLALRAAEQEFFERMAAAVTERADYRQRMRPFAATLGPDAAAGLDRAIAADHLYADATRRRAAAYGASSWTRRALRLARNAAAGDYRARRTGGLGGGSMLRDAVLMLPPSSGA